MDELIVATSAADSARSPTVPHNNEPDVSPDGTKIVFVFLRDGDAEIYVANVAGPARRT